MGQLFFWSVLFSYVCSIMNIIPFDPFFLIYIIVSKYFQTIFLSKYFQINNLVLFILIFFKIIWW